ncbi:hypothetical protein IFO70_19520 [Phormidium tenue FACHB-886]|nr:hypothetical protein [Phormidium tenue FACHB-886]
MFEAPLEAELKIYIMQFSAVALVEVVACDRLTVITAQI